MLYEREDRLGGQLLLAAEPPYKNDLAILTDYLVRQVRKVGVEIELTKEVEAALVADIKPDVLILATGILPLIPQIPGIDRDCVVTAEEVLSHKAKVGRRVIILGGGIVGCETALLLADQGKRVTIVEMLPAMATKIVPSIREALLGTLSGKGVVMLTNIRVEEITSSSMVITDADGKPQIIDADNIVLAAGAVSNNRLAERLRGKVEELYVIGDAMEPRRIKEAISEGYNVGRRI
jgi:pyruvate/2-oxoglutarate dehydrogenase complex dihydrolipoamide dehydrogenase (E3) component